MAQTAESTSATDSSRATPSSKRGFKLKTIMKSTKFRIPKYDFPIRLRLWFIALTCIIMVILALLGFTQSAQSLVPVNDKVLHFTCFALATGVMYFVIDVDEDARRIWMWRNLNLLFTLFACFFCGGIVSEFVQSMLPYKTFQWGDIVANLLGCSLGLLIAYHLERQYRHRREIQRLYRPITMEAQEYESEESDDEAVDATQLLPLHYGRDPSSPAPVTPKTSTKARTLRNVWDAQEEIFGIGDSDEDSDSEAPSRKAKGTPTTNIPETKAPS